MSYTSEKFNVAMSALRKIHDQDMERMNNDWAKLREKKDKQLPKMLKEAKKEATASLKIENTKIKEEIKELKKENTAIRKENDNIVAYHKKCGVQCSQEIFDRMIDTIKELKEENASLKNVTGQMFVATSPTVVQKYREEVKELKEELNDTTMKSSARHDIILNLFDVIIKKTNIDDSFEDSFDVGREWGNKYIDLWNKIVTDELKLAVETINEHENGPDEVECFVLETDGYHFDWRYVDGEESEEDED